MYWFRTKHVKIDPNRPDRFLEEPLKAWPQSIDEAGRKLQSSWVEFHESVEYWDNTTPGAAQIMGIFPVAGPILSTIMLYGCPVRYGYILMSDFRAHLERSDEPESLVARWDRIVKENKRNLPLRTGSRYIFANIPVFGTILTLLGVFKVAYNQQQAVLNSFKAWEKWRSGMGGGFGRFMGKLGKLPEMPARYRSQKKAPRDNDLERGLRTPYGSGKSKHRGHSPIARPPKAKARRR